VSTNPPLVALDGFVPPDPLVETSALGLAGKSIAAGRSLVWVQGEAGSGKTTAVARALSSSRDFAGIRRIACFPGLRLEEVLYAVNDLLRQLGINDLAMVLDQRSPLLAKLGVLLRVIAEYPVALWLDDFQDLTAGDGKNSKKVLAEFLQGYASLSGNRTGLLVITSEEPPPPVVPDPLVIPPLGAGEAQNLWSALDGSRPPRADPVDLTALPARLRSQPLALELTRRLTLHRGCSGEHEILARNEAAIGAEEVCSALTGLLAADARALLEVLAISQRPPSRQALRELTAAGGQEVVLGSAPPDARLVELGSSGLVRLNRDTEDVAPVTLHPLVQRVVERRARTRDPERWKNLLSSAAGYYVRLRGKGGNFWNLHRARCLLFRAGCYPEAYELHKCYLENLLQLGYLDLARQVLAETVSTTSGQSRAVCLGNLAMIHKSQANYDQALKLYEELQNEFRLLGDFANLARVLHQLGNTRYLKNDLSGALGCYRRSLELSTELGDPAIATATRIQIANMLYQLNRLQEALENYERIVEALLATGNNSMIAAVRLQMGQIHLQDKRYMEAATQLEEAAREAGEVNDRRSLLKVLKTQALVALEQREYDQSAAAYRDAVRVACELGDFMEAAVCKILHGDLERRRVRLRHSLALYMSARQTVADRTVFGTSSDRERKHVHTTVQKRLTDLATTMGAVAFRRALTEATRKREIAE
jgi:tetratricopeptide (TPR) repeat protein